MPFFIIIDQYLYGEIKSLAFPESCISVRDENLRIAKARAEEGQPVVYITIKKLDPAPRSRIIGPQIEYAKTG